MKVGIEDSIIHSDALRGFLPKTERFTPYLPRGLVL
jgi:hypothetical protein